MSISLLWSFNDGQGDGLKRFQQTLGRGAGVFALRIPGIQAGQFRPLHRQLTTSDTFQQRQDPQRYR
jgi:hypothetical protein